MFLETKLEALKVCDEKREMRLTLTKSKDAIPLLILVVASRPLGPPNSQASTQPLLLVLFAVKVATWQWEGFHIFEVDVVGVKLCMISRVNASRKERRGQVQLPAQWGGGGVLNESGHLAAPCASVGFTRLNRFPGSTAGNLGRTCKQLHKLRISTCTSGWQPRCARQGGRGLSWVGHFQKL